MANLSLIKKSYNKNAFESTVNTNFSQLANTAPTSPVEEPTPDVNQFFQDYQTLFFQIPKLGSTNSHEYLVKTSGAYIGDISNNNATIQALIQEVNTLRQQNLELQQNQIQQTLQQAQEAISTVSTTLNG